MILLVLNSQHIFVFYFSVFMGHVYAIFFDLIMMSENVEKFSQEIILSNSLSQILYSNLLDFVILFVSVSCTYERGLKERWSAWKFLPLKIQQLENEQFKGLLWVFSSDKLCHLINAIVIYFSEQATSEFEKPSLSKWD